MSTTTIAPFWLRLTSAALTAWCAFFGTYVAVMSIFYQLAIYRIFFGADDHADPGESVGYLYHGLLMLGAAVVAFFTVRWQWSRMRNSVAGDHYRLAGILIFIAIAVGPQLFIYTSF